MRIKIHGGTARHDEPSLCLTCRFVKVAQGPRCRDKIVPCSQLEAPVTFKVVSCTEYVHRRHPSLWHMEDIAWVLRTDAKRRAIGFVRAKDLKLTERHVLSDDDCN
jgi:hypothetical protein